MLYDTSCDPQEEIHLKGPSSPVIRKLDQGLKVTLVPSQTESLKRVCIINSRGRNKYTHMERQAWNTTRLREIFKQHKDGAVMAHFSPTWEAEASRSLWVWASQVYIAGCSQPCLHSSTLSQISVTNKQKSNDSLIEVGIKTHLKNSYGIIRDPAQLKWLLKTKPKDLHLLISKLSTKL